MCSRKSFVFSSSILFTSIASSLKLAPLLKTFRILAGKIQQYTHDYFLETTGELTTTLPGSSIKNSWSIEPSSKEYCPLHNLSCPELFH